MELQQTSLPRGGVVVDTSAGPIQVGMPPETIKDSMELGRGIPEYFIVPSEPFIRTIGPSMGINVAEFEFPAYCNFFFKRRSVTLIVESKDQEDRIRRVFQETLFGPEQIDIENDYDPSLSREKLPDLAKELGYFRKFGDTLMTIDMLLKFAHFNENSICTIGGSVTIESTLDNYFVITDSNTAATTCVDGRIKLPIPTICPTICSTEPFDPPEFGVTVLGNSHGFDPIGKTSGYVIWINHRGIMVDPPPFSSLILEANGIPPILIDGVIVTHCHADHDAGTFQKVLQEGKITLITTSTIYKSFLRKYSALSGLDSAFLSNVLAFRPVRINSPHMIRGASFRFFYSLHSIPCIGFEVGYGGKKIAFSGDHLNDPEKIQALFQDGIINTSRREELLNFPWHCDLILHEAGVPPIHTPIKTLENLPDDVKQKLYVVHSSEKDIAAASGLKQAPEGVENTLILPVSHVQHAKALEILDLIRRIDIFTSLTLSDAYELLQMCHDRTYMKGEHVVRRGTFGDSFYVIVRGEADVIVSHDDQKSAVVKKYVSGDFFGEQALMNRGGIRTADIIASSTLQVLEFKACNFTWILEHTDAPNRIRQLTESRSNGVWDILLKNSVFATLSSFQKTQLEFKLRKVTFKANTSVWNTGDLCDFAVFIQHGSFRLSKAPTLRRRRRSFQAMAGKDVHPDGLEFTNGAFLGEIDSLMSSERCVAATSLLAKTSGAILRIEKVDLHHFLLENPGVLLALSGRDSIL